MEYGQEGQVARHRPPTELTIGSLLGVLYGVPPYVVIQRRIYKTLHLCFYLTSSIFPDSSTTTKSKAPFPYSAQTSSRITTTTTRQWLPIRCTSCLASGVILPLPHTTSHRPRQRLWPRSLRRPRQWEVGRSTRTVFSRSPPK